jgi:hypothetical protein
MRPQNVKQWERFYLDKLAEMLKERSINFTAREYIEDLGRKLYTKITEVIQAEIEDISEEECVQYVFQLVIDGTFVGYQTEIKTIYEQVQDVLELTIKPAPDKWDRLYNVDFYIEVGKFYIGLQIKPLSYEQTPEIYRWKEWLSATHNKFEKDKGGKVFIIFSVRDNGRKVIHNREILKEIFIEIERLKGK